MPSKGLIYFGRCLSFVLGRHKPCGHGAGHGGQVGEGKVPGYQFSEQEQRYLTAKKEIAICVDFGGMPFGGMDMVRYVGIGEGYMALLEEKIGVPLTLLSGKSLGQSTEHVKARKCDFLTCSMKSTRGIPFMAVAVWWYSLRGKATRSTVNGYNG